MRGRAVAAVAAGVAALFALLPPQATHGAFSATVTGASTAQLNPWFGCRALAAGAAGSAVFEYGLDDAEGSTSASDLSGHGVTGAYSPSAHVAHDAAAPCRWDDDLVWSPGGSSELDTPSIGLPSNFAYETWFRTASGNRILMSIEVPGYGSVNTIVDGSGALVLGGLGSEFLRANASVADDRWHQVILDAGNGALSFWVDGVQLPGNSFNVPDGLTVVVHIGSGSTSGAPSSMSGARPFDGRMRFAALYSRVLSATEVRQHWAAAEAMSTTSSPSPTTSTGASATATPGQTASATATPDQPASSAPASTTASPVGSATASSQPVQQAPVGDDVSGGG